MQLRFTFGWLGALVLCVLASEVRACPYCGQTAAAYAGNTYYNTGVSSYYPSLGYYTSNYYAVAPTQPQPGYIGYQTTPADFGVGISAYRTSSYAAYAPPPAPPFGQYGYNYANWGMNNTCCRGFWQSGSYRNSWSGGGLGGIYGAYSIHDQYSGCNSCGVMPCAATCDACSNPAMTPMPATGPGAAGGNGPPAPPPAPEAAAPPAPVAPPPAKPEAPKPGPDARRYYRIPLR